MDILDDNRYDFSAHLGEYLRAHSDTTRAILQAGACERKAEGLLQAAMESWLADHSSNLFCLTEHKRVDFAWVRRESVGRNALAVDVAFEVKFNYAAQADLERRPGDTREQLARYQCVFPSASTYFIYFVVDLACPVPMADLPTVAPCARDLGWGRAGGFDPNRLEQRVESMHSASAKAGFDLLATAGVVVHEWRLHLSLFKLPAIMAEQEVQNVACYA